MILLTGFYPDPDPSRREEFFECIRRNDANGSFHEIHVCAEYHADPAQIRSSHSALASSKVRLISHGRRLTYRDLFLYANLHLCGESVVIANADMYFDDTLRRLEEYDLSGKLLCLSRWDVQKDGTTCFFDHPCSQDVWIFRAPIIDFFSDFHLGVLGCDNRLAWEAKQAGLEISNPSRSVHANHLHLSAIRRYKTSDRLQKNHCHQPRSQSHFRVGCAGGGAFDNALAACGDRRAAGDSVRCAGIVSTGRSDRRGRCNRLQERSIAYLHIIDRCLW